MEHPFIPLVAYDVLCVFWAYANARYIKADGPILHWANFLIHLATCGYFATQNLLLAFCMLLTARPLFDSVTSLARDLDWDYVSPDPGSRIDRLEKAVFGDDGASPKILYLLLAGVCAYLLALQ